MAGRGRPPKDEASKKSITLGIRVTPALRDQLEAARVEATRTLSQEIEARLRLSFSERQEEFGSQTTYWFLYFLAKGMGRMERETGHRWFEDRLTFELCRRFVADEMLPALKPRGRAPSPARLKAYGDLPEHVATTLLGLLQLSLSRPDDPDPIHRAALPLAVRIKKPALRDLRKRFVEPMRVGYAIMRDVFGPASRGKLNEVAIRELEEKWDTTLAKWNTKLAKKRERRR